MKNSYYNILSVILHAGMLTIINFVVCIHDDKYNNNLDIDDFHTQS